MVVVSLFTIGANEFRRLRSEQESTASEFAVAIPVSEGQTLPDIYYIVLDRYAGAATLAEFYGLDNSDFLDHLTGKRVLCGVGERRELCEDFAVPGLVPEHGIHRLHG